jgi:hypothetical protein
MNRRYVLGVFGAGLAGAALSARKACAQRPHRRDRLHRECLKACQACSILCNQTFRHGFGKVKDGHADHDRTAIVTVDCQAFCRLAAELIARGSPLIATACLACADACELCEVECSRHDDPRMKECAEACNQCEKACRSLASAIATAPAGAALEKE